MITETETVTEMATEGGTETGTEAVTEAADETETEIPEEISEAQTEEETEEISESETEEETEPWDDEDTGYSYSGGYAGYYWDESWYISSDFRFTRVDKDYALIGGGKGTFVYEEEKKSSRRVGEIPYGGVVCILKEADDGWAYIECGDIRGFVPEGALTKGDAAEQVINAVCEQALTQGDLLCEKADNGAFTYTKTTSYPVMARKVYAMSLTSTWIYEYPDQSSRFVGDVVNGTLVYVLKDAKKGWCYIESGDVRGFVPMEALLLGDGAKQIVNDLGEENAPLAEQLIDPEENRSVYYTLLSVKSAGNSIGSDICRAATGFVGKLPYVYGGTSLSSGADCSGFVMSVFANFGISLPHNAAAQSSYGTAVDASSLAPGDLVFYSDGSGISHVAIYIGNGSIVHAANSSSGICYGSLNYNTPVAYRRLV